MPRAKARKTSVAKANGGIASGNAGAYIDVRPSDAG